MDGGTDTSNLGYYSPAPLPPLPSLPSLPLFLPSSLPPSAKHNQANNNNKTESRAQSHKIK